MPNFVKYAKDKDKCREARNRQRKRYYDKTAIYGKRPWTPEQDKMVLNHDITDYELSKIIHHSMRAIQKRRCTLKKQLTTK